MRHTQRGASFAAHLGEEGLRRISRADASGDLIACICLRGGQCALDNGGTPHTTVYQQTVNRLLLDGLQHGSWHSDTPEEAEPEAPGLEAWREQGRACHCVCGSLHRSPFERLLHMERAAGSTGHTDCHTMSESAWAARGLCSTCTRGE